MADQQTTIVISAVDKTAAAINSVKSGLDSIKGSAASVQNALAGLAGAAGLTALAASVGSAISATAALKYLSEQTGATVEGLSALGSVGRLTGTSLDQIGGSLTKLAKNMVSLGDEGKDAARAIQAIGLDVQKIQQMRPDAAMLEIAQAFSNFADGAGKTAAAMMLFGKEGAKMLPFLNDLADVGKLQARVTTEQALAADELQKNWVRLQASGAGWQRELANGIVPSLKTATEVLLEMVNGAGGLREEMRKLSADGSLREWADDAVDALVNVGKAASGVAKAVRLVGTWAGTRAAQVSATLSGTDKAAINEASSRDLDAILSVDSWNRIDERLAARRAQRGAQSVWMAMAEGQAVRSQIDVPLKPKKEGGAQVSDYEKLVKAIGEKMAAQSAELSLQEDLTEAQKEYSKWLADVTSGNAKLSTAEMAKAAAMWDSYIRQSQAVKLQKEMKKAVEETDKANTKALEELKKQIAAEQEHIDTLGMTKAQQAEYAAGKLDVAAAAKQTEAALLSLQAAELGIAGADEEQIQIAARQADALRQQSKALSELAAKKRESAAKEVAVEQAKESAEAWNNFARDIESSLTDALMRSFENGEGFGQAFVKNLRNLLKTAALKIAIQAVVTPSVNGLVSALGGPASALGGGGVGGLFNMASGGSSIYNSINGIPGYGGGVYNTFATSGVGQWLGLSTQTGASAPVAIEAAQEVGGVILGGEQTFAAPALTELGGALGAALPWIGGALAIASLLGGDLFGSQGAPKHNMGTAFTGTGSGATAGNLQSLLGWSEGYAGQSDLQNAIYTDAVRAIVARYAPDASYGVMLGGHINDKGRSQNQTDARVTNAAGQTVYDYGPDSGQGTEDFQKFAQESIPKIQLAIIADAFRSASDDYKVIADSILGTSTDLTDSIKGLSADAATAVQQQLAAAGALLDQLKAAFGDDITGQVAVDLGKAAGGFANLSANLATYYESFFSTEEKAAQVREDLQKQFDAINLALPDSREGFRDLVESLDLTTESGQKSFATLMGLSGAFASVTEAVEAEAKAQADAAIEIARKRAAMENQILRLTGDEAAALAVERQAELAAMDESLRPLQERIYALQDEASAAQKAKEAEAARLAKLRATAEEALQILGNAIDKEREAAQAAYDSRLAILDAQKAAAQTAYESRAAELKATVSSAQTLSRIFEAAADRIAGTLASMRPEGMDAALADNARATIRQYVASGTAPTGDTLDMLLRDASAIRPDDYASRADYLSAFYSARADIEALSGIANRQATSYASEVALAERQVAIAEEQYRAQQAAYEQAARSAADQLDATSKGFDALIKAAQDQFSEAAGTKLAVLGLNDALSSYAAALVSFANATKNPISTALPAVPAYAAGGTASPGWALVGEEGPELAYFGDTARIYDAGTTASLMSGQVPGSTIAALEKRLADLTDRVQAGFAAVAVNTNRTAKQLERWDADGLPETATA